MSDERLATTPLPPAHTYMDDAPPEVITLCEIPSLSGVLTIVDAKTITTQWKTHSNCGGQWAIDLRGEQAEYLATRMTAYRDTIEKLVGHGGQY